MGRGGARTGAGRKSLGDAKRRQVSFLLSATTEETITEVAARWGISKGKAVDYIVEFYKENGAK